MNRVYLSDTFVERLGEMIEAEFLDFQELNGTSGDICPELQGMLQKDMDALIKTIDSCMVWQMYKSRPASWWTGQQEVQ